jgi:hypothetical protein
MTNILGLEVRDIPESYTPVGVYALVECLNDEGKPVYVVRHAGMDGLRRYGALEVLVSRERTEWINWFEPDGDDDD